MSKQLKSERVNETNPEWMLEDFAKARPASDVLPGLFGKAQANEMLQPKHVDRFNTHTPK